MAAMNYNELTNCAEIVGESLDPMFYYDARFPTERTLKLHMRMEEPMPARGPNRRSKGRSKRDRNSARFKTQPITFDEIKEVDEEADENKETLKTQFTAFSKSMEALVRTPSYRRKDYPRTTTPTSDTDSSVTSHDVSPSSHASSNSSLEATSVSASRERFHKRRKKRFHRSIEEVPDLEKDLKVDTDVSY